MSGHNEKARRYIDQLDDARVKGTWSEAPELIRKITKHAPHRKLLIATATLEHELVKDRSAAVQPSSSTEKPSLPFASLLEKVKHEIAQPEAAQFPQEAIQGRTSIWWAHWITGSDQDAFNPGTTTAPHTEEEEDPSYSLWTKICVVKATFIQGNIFNARGSHADADLTYKRAIPLLNLNQSAIASTPQLAYWAEHLMAEIAIFRTSQDVSDGESKAAPTFKQWALLATKGTQSSASAYGHARSPRSRLSVWRIYYKHLSDILETTPDHPLHLRSDLVPELRQVETAYENELLRTVQFPKAGESNLVIEEWVEQVVHNWETLCGSQWLEKHLGDGGRNSVGRHVIDILYRAATKTFQSTLILRRLFQVHKSLTDFDLAYRALDTYLELIDRARIRTAKSKEAPTGQDSEEIVLLTIAEGIEGLSAFGNQAEAERAYNLCIKLEELLREVDPSGLIAAANGPVLNGDTHHAPTSIKQLSPHCRDVIHRALGVGKANWARWTPFTENRSSLQLDATAHLRLAVSQPISVAQKIKSTYALGLLLAETREIDGAIAAIKPILVQDPTTSTERHLVERQLIPVWHLLSLLLTSRQDFDTAGQSCVAAFEQFSSSSTLSEVQAANSKSEPEQPSWFGLIDDLECTELQTILEVRMTELALTELVEGPEHAVNSSNDLLALYTRLFAHLDLGSEEKPRLKATLPPKSSAGTVKSIRGSLFHRKRVTSANEVFDEKANGTASIRTDTTRPQTQATQAPTIRVTDEDKRTPVRKHHSLFRHSRESSRHEKSQASQASSSQHHTPKKLVRPASRERKHAPPPSSAFSSQRQSFETSQEAPPSSTGTAETAQPHLSPILSADETPRPSTPPATDLHNSDNEVTPTAKQPLPSIQHNLASHSDVPPPSGHATQPPEQDTRLPSIPRSHPPVPRFPRTAAQRHATAILAKIWLIIAKLYRRANMYDDSREATDEAAKAALKIESIVASVESSARAFADPGWGGCGKSSDEVWADVYCERGECALSLAIAKVEVDQRNQVNGSTPHERPDTHDESQMAGQVDSDGIRDAVDMFEQCLMYFPDHAGGIVGLSNILLDYYERKVELGRKVDDGKAKTQMLASRSVDRLSRGLRSSVSGRGAGQRWQSFDVNTSTSTPGAITGATSTNANANKTGVSNHDVPSSDPERPSLTHAATMTGLNFNPSSTPDDLLTLDSNLKKTPDNLNRLAARDRAYGLLSTLTKLGSGWDNSEAWYALARAHELGGEIDRAKEILFWVIELEETRPIRSWSNLGRGYVL